MEVHSPEGSRVQEAGPYFPLGFQLKFLSKGTRLPCFFFFVCLFVLNTTGEAANVFSQWKSSTQKLVK